MLVKSFLPGEKPRKKLKEMVLEEHLECGCECDKEMVARCAGRFNQGTCECECGMREFGQARLVCGMQRDKYWDYEACQCKSKSVVPRGVDEQQGCDLYPVSARRGYSILDIAGWVLLGSCLALVVILAAATWHYRWVYYTVIYTLHYRWINYTDIHTLDYMWVYCTVIHDLHYRWVYNTAII